MNSNDSQNSDDFDDPNDDVEFINGELQSAKWAWINPHANRDRVIVISPELEISKVAEAFVKDEQAQVKTWIDSGLITKPTLSQLEFWRKEPNKTFNIRIVQPWVIIQDPGH